MANKAFEMCDKNQLLSKMFLFIFAYFYSCMSHSVPYQVTNYFIGKGCAAGTKFFQIGSVLTEGQNCTASPCQDREVNLDQRVFFEQSSYVDCAQGHKPNISGFAMDVASLNEYNKENCTDGKSSMVFPTGCSLALEDGGSREVTCSLTGVSIAKYSKCTNCTCESTIDSFNFDTCSSISGKIFKAEKRGSCSSLFPAPTTSLDGSGGVVAIHAHYIYTFAVVSATLFLL